MKWEQLEGLAIKTCLSFAQTTGFPLDELLSEARVAYMKTYLTWERTRGAKFSTMYTTTLRNHLTDYCYNEGNRRKPLTHSCELMEYHHTTGDTTSRKALLNIAISRASHEAQVVLRIVFHTPTALVRTMARSRNETVILPAIARYLKRTLGWPEGKTERVFEEVRQLVQDYA